MKILAMLQNPWFKPGTRQEVIDRFRDDEAFMRRLLLRSKTGKRIVASVGEHLTMMQFCDASPIHGFTSNSCNKADIDHIKQQIERHNPDIVICFGRIAGDGVDCLNGVYQIIKTPHPARCSNAAMMELKRQLDESVYGTDQNGDMGNDSTRQ